MEMDQKLCLLEMTRKFMSMTAQFKHQRLQGQCHRVCRVDCDIPCLLRHT